MTHDNFVKLIKTNGESIKGALEFFKIWIDEAENLLTTLLGTVVDTENLTEFRPL
jgi:hypothetical protein